MTGGMARTVFVAGMSIGFALVPLASISFPSLVSTYAISLPAPSPDRTYLATHQEA